MQSGPSSCYRFVPSRAVRIWIISFYTALCLLPIIGFAALVLMEPKSGFVATVVSTIFAMCFGGILSILWEESWLRTTFEVDHSGISKRYPNGAFATGEWESLVSAKFATDQLELIFSNGARVVISRLLKHSAGRNELMKHIAVHVRQTSIAMPRELEIYLPDWRPQPMSAWKRALLVEQFFALGLMFVGGEGRALGFSDELRVTLMIAGALLSAPVLITAILISKRTPQV